MDKKRDSTELYWIIGIFGLTALLFLSRGLAWLIPTVIVPGLFIFLSISIYRTWKQKKRQRDSVAEDLYALAENCSQELEKLAVKSRVIADSKFEIQQRLRQGNLELDEALRKETEALLGQYSEQEDVITAKRVFYEDIGLRIQTLLEKKEWKRQLLRKQLELEQLKGDHYQEVEKMEELKQDLAYSEGFVQAVSELSSEVLASSSATDIAQLKRELQNLFPK